MLDLVWIPAEGGDATVISPARGASRPHFRQGSRSDLPDDASGPGLDAVRRHRPPNASGGHGQDRAIRPASPTRPKQIVVSPDGRWALASVTTQLYLLALPQARRRGTQGVRPRAVRRRSKSSPTSVLTTPPGPTAARRSPGRSAPAFSACPSIRSSSLRSRATTKTKGRTKKKSKPKRKHERPKPEEAGRRDRASRGTGRAARLC